MSSEWLKPETLKRFLSEDWSLSTTDNPRILHLINSPKAISVGVFVDDQSIDASFIAKAPLGTDIEDTEDWCDEAERVFENYAKDDWDLVGFEQEGTPEFLYDEFRLGLSRKFETIGELQAILRWLSTAVTEVNMEGPA